MVGRGQNGFHKVPFRLFQNKPGWTHGFKSESHIKSSGIELCVKENFLYPLFTVRVYFTVQILKNVLHQDYSDHLSCSNNGQLSDIVHEHLIGRIR